MDSRHLMLALPEAIIAAEAAIPKGAGDVGCGATSWPPHDAKRGARLVAGGVDSTALADGNTAAAIAGFAHSR